MPRLSLYRSEKSHDYRFFDRIIKEQFYVGGTDLYIHKYLGITDNQTETISIYKQLRLCYEKPHLRIVEHQACLNLRDRQEKN